MPFHDILVFRRNSMLHCLRVIASYLWKVANFSFAAFGNRKLGSLINRAVFLHDIFYFSVVYILTAYDTIHMQYLRSSLKFRQARPRETRPDRPKMRLGQAPPSSAEPGRILGSVPSVTGQTGQFTRAAKPMSVFCIPA